MKKTGTFRAAALLLALVLVTSCFVGSTFARYVTKDEGEDSARVAKFGVTASITGSLFAQDYYEVGSGNGVADHYTGSVDSIDGPEGTKIVAPGTKNDKGVTIKVTGTPEVSTKLTFNFDEEAIHDIYLVGQKYATMVKASGVTEDNVQDYYLKAGNTYTKAVAGSFDSTKANDYYKLIGQANLYTYSDEYDTDEMPQYDDESSYYFPVDYYVSVDNTPLSGSFNSLWQVFGTGPVYTDSMNNLSKIFDYQENPSDIEMVNSKVSLDKSVTITWNWNYSSSPENETDMADTIFGNLIAYDADSSNYQVVVVNRDETCTGLTTSTLNGVKYVYASTDEEPIGCLTAAFNASIVIEQVD